MTDHLKDMTGRLLSASNSICDEPPLAGVTEEDIGWIKKKFAAWSFPLPSELLSIWRVSAGTPHHEYDRSLLKAALGIKSPDDPDVDVLAGYDIERYGILNLGNSRDVSLTMSRDGRISLGVMAYDIQPKSFPYSFEEGFTKYVGAVEAEVAKGCFGEDEE